MIKRLLLLINILLLTYNLTALTFKSAVFRVNGPEYYVLTYGLKYNHVNNTLTFVVKNEYKYNIYIPLCEILLYETSVPNRYLLAYILSNSAEIKFDEKDEIINFLYSNYVVELKPNESQKFIYKLPETFKAYQQTNSVHSFKYFYSLRKTLFENTTFLERNNKSIIINDYLDENTDITSIDKIRNRPQIFCDYIAFFYVHNNTNTNNFDFSFPDLNQEKSDIGKIKIFNPSFIERVLKFTLFNDSDSTIFIRSKTDFMVQENQEKSSIKSDSTDSNGIFIFDDDLNILELKFNTLRQFYIDSKYEYIQILPKQSLPINIDLSNHLVKKNQLIVVSGCVYKHEGDEYLKSNVFNFEIFTDQE